MKAPRKRDGGGLNYISDYEYRKASARNFHQKIKNANQKKFIQLIFMHKTNSSS